MSMINGEPSFWLRLDTYTRLAEAPARCRALAATLPSLLGLVDGEVASGASWKDAGWTGLIVLGDVWKPRTRRVSERVWRALLSEDDITSFSLFARNRRLNLTLRLIIYDSRGSADLHFPDGVEMIIGRDPFSKDTEMSPHLLSEPLDVAKAIFAASEPSGGFFGFQHGAEYQDAMGLSHVRDLRSKLRSFGWATHLGPELLDVLGGSNRVVAEAPCRVTDDWPTKGGGMLLTLTPSVLDAPLESVMASLHAFLAPVLDVRENPQPLPHHGNLRYI